MPEILAGDQIRLKMVLINLLKNATKFTHVGTIKIVSHYEEANELLKVCITDSGKGFKESEKDQMFKIFNKGEISGDDENTCMGLYICKHIVEKCGGTITIYSEGENKGTTVSFTMKMRKMDPLLEDAL